MPKSRSPKQRWIHWNIESPQYVTVDIAKLNGMFNWTMTHKRTSDFWLPYGRVVKVREHPKGKVSWDSLKYNFFRGATVHLSGWKSCKLAKVSFSTE